MSFYFSDDENVYVHWTVDEVQELTQRIHLHEGLDSLLTFFETDFGEQCWPLWLLTPFGREYAAYEQERYREEEIRRLPYHLRGLLGIHLPRDCFDMVLHLSQMVNTHGVAPPAVELPVDEDEDVMDYEGDESNDSAYDTITTIIRQCMTTRRVMQTL